MSKLTSTRKNPTRSTRSKTAQVDIKKEAHSCSESDFSYESDVSIDAETLYGRVLKDDFYDSDEDEKSEEEKVTNSSCKKRKREEVNDSTKKEVKKAKKIKSEIDHPNQDSQAKSIRKSKKARKTYTCKIGDFTTNHNSNFHLHQDLHQKKYRHECDVCPVKFMNRHDFVKHMKMHDKNIDKTQFPYACKVCNGRFMKILTRNLHEVKFHNHHRERNDYVCEECGFVVSTKSGEYPGPNNRHVVKHAKIHSKERLDNPEKYPYKCACCKSRFSRLPARNKHETVTHKLERRPANPVLCKICGYETKYAYLLKLHSQIHDKKKINDPHYPHKCKICNGAYANAAPRNYHEVEVHKLPRREKGFRCQHCTYFSTNLQSMKLHKKIHDEKSDDYGNRKFECGKCNARFFNAGQRNIHENKFH